ncbi:MAG: hypothetical protein WBX17_09860 [Microbacterium sp.]
MSWVLFQEGRRRPPRTEHRRMVWALVVFVFCGGLLPFVVVGVVQSLGTGSLGDAAVFGFLGLMLLAGAAAAVIEVVRFLRARRAR